MTVVCMIFGCMFVVCMNDVCTTVVCITIVCMNDVCMTVVCVTFFIVVNYYASVSFTQLFVWYRSGFIFLNSCYISLCGVLFILVNQSLKIYHCCEKCNTHI